MKVVADLDVPAERIIYANCCKGPTHLQSAAKLGIELMTFDNESELLKIKQYFPTAKLLLRIMVEKSSAKIQMGTKFGCEFTLIEHLLEAATRHNLSVAGVSFHIGSLAQDPNDFAVCIEKSLHTFLTGEKLGHRMTILDIGGGFPGEADSIEKFKEFTCRNCGGGDRGRVAIYRPFGEVSLSLNRTVWCSRPTTGVPLAHAMMNFVGLVLTTSDRTATAGSDVVQSGRPIFDDFFQHLWPYIGNNTANVVFQMVKRLWLIRIDQRLYRK
ncbi:ornithine decarboxylase [Trichonephila clavipes]|nr:ornithine decarboxylase [Trichonephila clavipes]